MYSIGRLLLNNMPTCVVQAYSLSGLLVSVLGGAEGLREASKALASLGVCKMGQILSSQEEAVNEVVLVPPLFERDHKVCKPSVSAFITANLLLPLCAC